MGTVNTIRDINVEMRDGVALATDVYRPADDGAYPALLQRLPYDKNNAASVGRAVNPLTAVERGYAVVVQDTRGRFSSEGEFEPYVDDADDGYDTVEWIADQDWCDGTVGTYGASYKGITAWQTIAADPPHLEAGVPTIGASTVYDGWSYSGGAFELGFKLDWAMNYLVPDALQRLDRPDEEMAALRERFARGFTQPQEMLEWLPLTDVPVFQDGVAPYWRDWLDHPTYDEYWKEVDVTNRVADINVPVLHATGWYDAFFPGHTAFYEAMEGDGEESVRHNHRMVIGPWDHSTPGGMTPHMAGDRAFGVDCVISQVLGDLTLEWFDYWLQGEDNGAADRPKVEYYVMGADEWRESPDWPPDHDPTRFYLTGGGNANSRFGDGVLGREQPADRVPADSFEYDPTDPVPTRGGHILMEDVEPAGVQNQAEIEEREDVLVYTTPRLTSALEIAGPVDATLYATTSAPDTDFTAKLVDVEPDGYCANVAEGIVRARYRNGGPDPDFLDPGRVYEFDVDLWATAHTFEPNHRVRLEVSSSNFPRFDRNPNGKVPPAEATEADFTVASQRVFHDAERPSHVTLPVLE